MLRPQGKAKKIADKVMKKEGVKPSPDKSTKQKPLEYPYLQH